jgi:hypothetical protein
VFEELEMKLRSHTGRAMTAGAIGALALAVGSLGVAAAANGGSLVLGHSNTASATTRLSDSSGTPLALHAGKNKAPLSVNSKTLVKNLNAQELDGLAASKLGVTASGAQSYAGIKDGILTKDIVLPAATGTSGQSDFRFQPKEVAQTARLAKGIYAVDASADGENAVCWVGVSPTLTSKQQVGVTENTSLTSLAISGLFTVSKGARLSLYCAAGGGQAGYIAADGITAILVAHPSEGSGVAPTTPSN